MNYITLDEIKAYTGATYTAEQEALLTSIGNSFEDFIERYCNRKWRGTELFALKYDCDTKFEDHTPPFTFGGGGITETITNGINKVVCDGGSGQSNFAISGLSVVNSIGTTIQFRMKVNSDLLDTASSNGFYFSDDTFGFEFNWDANHIYFNADVNEVVAVNTKVWHIYKIDIIGESWKLYIDGNLVLSLTNTMSGGGGEFTLYIEPINGDPSEHEWDYLYITKGVRNYFTEKFDGGTDTFLVKNPPINELISFKEDDVITTSIYPYETYVRTETKTEHGIQNVEIKYSGGYPFPDALKQALIKWVADEYEKQGAGGGATVEVGEVKSIGVGPVSVTYGSPNGSEGSQTSSSSGLLSGVPEDVADVLRLYRKNPL